MSREYLVATGVGGDKVGKVELISDVLASRHANIEDFSELSLSIL